MSGARVKELSSLWRDEVVGVLAGAFAGYEAFSYMLGDDAGDFDMVRELVGFFVDLRFERGGIVLGAEPTPGSGLVAAALVDPPHAQQPSRRRSLGELLGPRVEDQMRRFGSAVAPLEPDLGFYYIGMIAVEERHRGNGYSRMLIDRVAELSDEDPDADGILLTTEHPPNIAIYESMGFESLGDASTADGLLRSWTMFRANPGSGT